MRKIILFFLCMSIAVVPVFADEQLSDDGEPVQANDNSTAVTVVDITQLLTQQETNNDDLQSVEVVEPTLVSTESTLLSVSANDTTGFKSVLLSVLGDYNTVVTDYTYSSNSGYTSHSIEIERDWAWICSCGVFALLVYCTFRAIGGVVARF